MARLLPAWLLLLLCSLPAVAHFGPQPRFTISVEHMPIEKVFQLIEKQSTYRLHTTPLSCSRHNPFHCTRKTAP